MRRWYLLAFLIAAAILAIFVIANATGIQLLNDPAPVMRAAKPVAAIAGITLLIADVFLPVPSIPIMVANGALFGIPGGALLSLIGSVGAALTGFAVGRAGNDLIRKFVTPREHERAGAMLKRWGVIAIVVSRPIPIVAETVAILAGSSPISWAQVFVASIAGSIVPCVAYAWAGASALAFGAQTLIFFGVMAMAALAFYAGRKISPQPE